MATVFSVQPRHVLTPLSPKKRKLFNNVTNILRDFDARSENQNGKAGLSFSKPSLAKKHLGLSTTTTSKRPFATVYDENSASQVKRIKSQMSPPSCEDSTIPKFALVTKPLSAVPSSIVKSKKKATVNAFQGSLKRRTHQSSHSTNRKSALHLSAISRKDWFACLSTSPAKTIKRKARKSVRRIDPPATLSKSENDIATIDGRLTATPVAKSDTTTTTTTTAFPNSWIFEIYEDTIEDTLTNLMYHGTNVLDISDDEEVKKGMSELDRVGKENIPPPPAEDVLAMPPPPAPASISGARKEEATDMVAERSRSPLGDVDVGVFYPLTRVESEEVEEL